MLSARIAENKKATLADGSISKPDFQNLDFKNSIPKTLVDRSRPRLRGISLKVRSCKVESMRTANTQKPRAKSQEPMAVLLCFSG
jgi:hypothetical protein